MMFGLFEPKSLRQRYRKRTQRIRAAMIHDLAQCFIRAERPSTEVIPDAVIVASSAAHEAIAIHMFKDDCLLMKAEVDLAKINDLSFGTNRFYEGLVRDEDDYKRLVGGQEALWAQLFKAMMSDILDIPSAAYDERTFHNEILIVMSVARMTHDLFFEKRYGMKLDTEPLLRANSDRMSAIVKLLWKDRALFAP